MNYFASLAAGHILSTSVIFFLTQSTLHTLADSSRLNISVSSPYQPTEGSRVDVDCSAVDRIPPIIDLHWLSPQKEKVPIQQPVDNLTIRMTIMKLEPDDAGVYTCMLESPNGHFEERKLSLHVTHANSSSRMCGHTMFRCANSEHCIFLRYRCDGNQNCQDGSDEIDCGNRLCRYFRCNNSKCINTSEHCDGIDNCGDKSDELNCSDLTHTTISLNIDEIAHFSWLKTTVYTVIACTVAVVILISFIVIVALPIKVKRMRARRLARAVESRRALTESERLERAPEQDPFLQIGLNSCYSNILVNVNNGVQYMPSPELMPFLDSPPAYSEIMNFHSHEEPPPPPYSTLDRLIKQAACTSNVREAGTSSAATPSCSGEETVGSSSLRPISSCDENSPVPGTSSCAIPHPNFTEEASAQPAELLQRCPLSSPQNAVGRTAMKGHLTVQGGRIIICGGDGGVAISAVDDGRARQGQLQVQGGQIVLKMDGNCMGRIEEESSSPTQGELEVQAGQIVLRLREH